MPYLFNGKELDSETGLYYYGARYLDSKTSLWLNTDPLSGYNPIKEHEHYIDGQHNGGIFNPMNLNTYTYTYQNPINFIDPNGKQVDLRMQMGSLEMLTYAKSPLLNVTKRELKNGRYIPKEFGFTSSVTHLLNLVSGVSYDNILATKIRFYKRGVGALTTGDSSSNAIISNFDVNPNDLINFLDLMSHEVGHIPQLDETKSNTLHIGRSILGYIKAAIENSSLDYEDYHDKAPLEKQAERGTTNFRMFNRFINKYYGKDKLKSLFENKNNTEKDKIERINQWFRAYIKNETNNNN